MSELTYLIWGLFDALKELKEELMRSLITYNTDSSLFELGSSLI